MNTQLRVLNSKDLMDVINIEQQAYRYPWPAAHFQDCLETQYAGWVLCVGNTIIGYLIVQGVVDELHLLNICVSPTHQHQGHGQYLLQHCIAFAKSQSLHSILLEVRASNLPAKKLYAQYSFQLIGVRKNYYPSDNGREDAEVYRLIL
jgi:ribosomal-protein-alanine N-acetyltransferase